MVVSYADLMEAFDPSPANVDPTDYQSQMITASNVIASNMLLASNAYADALSNYKRISGVTDLPSVLKMLKELNSNYSTMFTNVQLAQTAYGAFVTLSNMPVNSNTPKDALQLKRDALIEFDMALSNAKSSSNAYRQAYANTMSKGIGASNTATLVVEVRKILDTDTSLILTSYSNAAPSYANVISITSNVAAMQPQPSWAQSIKTMSRDSSNNMNKVKRNVEAIIYDLDKWTSNIGDKVVESAQGVLQTLRVASDTMSNAEHGFPMVNKSLANLVVDRQKLPASVAMFIDGPCSKEFSSLFYFVFFLVVLLTITLIVWIVITSWNSVSRSVFRPRTRLFPVR